MSTIKPTDDSILITNSSEVHETKVIDQKSELIEVMSDGKQKESSSESLAKVDVSIDPAIMEKVRATADIIFSDSDSPE
jgi:hypothetical protein